MMTSVNTDQPLLNRTMKYFYERNIIRHLFWIWAPCFLCVVVDLKTLLLSLCYSNCSAFQHTKQQDKKVYNLFYSLSRWKWCEKKLRRRILWCFIVRYFFFLKQRPVARYTMCWLLLPKMGFLYISCNILIKYSLFSRFC